jgi:hypothetical protein
MLYCVTVTPTKPFALQKKHLIYVSASGPAGVLSQRVNQVLRVPNPDGDARMIHGDLF